MNDTNMPVGRVTFLFTDIDGSTQLLQLLGDRYGDVLNDQKQILRSSFARHSGYEVDNQGDSFFFAFPNAAEGLAAAVDAQRALISHSWVEGVKLRVRMGLHTGNPIISNERYVGIDVHRAARVGAAGHGGQVLLTDATRQEAGDSLPPGVSVRDLGEVRLKDLKKPEHVFQVIALYLPDNFPPLKVVEGLDGHYEVLVRALCEGRVVPFLGAGVNLCGRPITKHWEQDQSATAPSANELARHLASNFHYPLSDPAELARVSEFVAIREGIGSLYDELRRVLQPEYQPTRVHKFLADLPSILQSQGCTGHQLIISASYDDILERTFRAAGEPFDLVYYAAEGEHHGKFMHQSPDGKLRPIDRPNKYLSLSTDDRTVIFKIHGMLDRQNRSRDSFVITEDHYIEYLSQRDVSQQVPAKLAEKMSWSHFLFMGHSLRDWNLRVILHRLWGDQKFKYKSWAIQPHPETLEAELWRTRDVEVIDSPLEDYIQGLEERTRNMPLKNAPTTSEA